MTTLAIIFGAISLVIFLYGLLPFIAAVSGYNNSESVGIEIFLTILGAVGLFLCITI